MIVASTLSKGVGCCALLCLLLAAGIVVPNPAEAVQPLALSPGSVRHCVEFHIK